MWASLIIALLSFFMMKKSGSSDTSAMVTAGLAGAGSYYVATETEWGQENLSWFEDSTESPTTSTTEPTTSTTPVLDSEGNPVKDSNGNVVFKMIDGTADVLKSWGGTGTAAVVGTTALAANSSLKQYLPWVLLGLGVFMVVK